MIASSELRLLGEGEHATRARPAQLTLGMVSAGSRGRAAPREPDTSTMGQLRQLVGDAGQALEIRLTPARHAAGRPGGRPSSAESRRAASPCTAKPIALRGPVASSGGSAPRIKPNATNVSLGIPVPRTK